MRSEDDIIQITVNMAARLELDLERVMNDPVGRTIAEKYDLTVSDQLYAMLVEYCEFYISRERFLSRAPSTNGPGSIQMQNVDIKVGEGEVRRYGEHTAT